MGYDIENMVKIYAAIRAATELEPMPDDAMDNLVGASGVILAEIIKTKAKTDAAAAAKFRFVGDIIDDEKSLGVLFNNEDELAQSAVDDLNALRDKQWGEIMGEVA